jgi:hypothetical protein
MDQHFDTKSKNEGVPFTCSSEGVSIWNFPHTGQELDQSTSKDCHADDYVR